MTEEKITLRDIKSALKTIKENSMPLRRIETISGFVEVDVAGRIHNIGINKETMEELNELLNYTTKDDCQQKTQKSIFEGMPIVIDKGID